MCALRNGWRSFKNPQRWSRCSIFFFFFSTFLAPTSAATQAKCSNGNELCSSTTSRWVVASCTISLFLFFFFCPPLFLPFSFLLFVKFVYYVSGIFVFLQINFNNFDERERERLHPPVVVFQAGDNERICFLRIAALHPIRKIRRIFRHPAPVLFLFSYHGVRGFSFYVHRH